MSLGHEDFSHLALDDLRRMRTTLTERETRVSYWRRILQARIDLIAAGSERGSMAVLSKVLTDAPSAQRRLAHLTVDLSPDDVPLPDLAKLWATEVDPGDPKAAAALTRDLRDAESRVSALRHDLFTQIDAVTSELIRRLHEQPSLALTALPQR